MYEHITSVQNPAVKAMRALKDAPARAESGQMLVEGEKMLREAAACGLAIGDLFFDEQREEKFLPLIALAHGRVFAAPMRILEAVCDTKSPQGVCAAVSLPAPLAPGEEAALLVALDGVQDPGNVGTIWRTADAAGFGGLLLGEGCADPLSPKVQRAAMGSGFRVPARREDDLAETLSALSGRGYQVIVSSLDGEDCCAHGPISDKLALVVGSEARGVSERVCGVSSLKLRLPMRGGAESLNAAVAAGILMYQLAQEWETRGNR